MATIQPTLPTISSPADKTKPYLEYLDKEMTIMGILSAVAIAAPAGILNVVMGDKSETAKTFWNVARPQIIVGSVSCVMAALLFYRQRSRLAWFYGQICLAEILEDEKVRQTKQLELCREADSWETWIPYSLGFTALFIGGFLEYVLALAFEPLKNFWKFNDRGEFACNILLIALPIVAIGTGILQSYVLRSRKFSEEPWGDFRADLRALFRSKSPHCGVYTRIKASPIHGVGVFAILDIPKDTYIFEPDDDDLISIPQKTVAIVSNPELKKLYEDFCVSKGDRVLCPKTFNQLTPSWFINNSENPNVEADSSLKFRAICEIKAGTELTVNYQTYDDTPTKVTQKNQQANG